MFVEKIKTPGLAHLSYVIGAGGRAAVIDPRRDCEVYLAAAAAQGCRITHILETHRNEDLLSGAPLLAAQTGAEVFHGPDPAGAIAYARTVCEGETFLFDKLLIKVLETPGHTDDSLSFAIYDTAFGADAVGVFTGDALFVGDVGRTDFYPDRAAEVAGLLYDSLGKILALGDQAILYPAHGAGSVCGNNMADREISTLGYERRHNPMLQLGDRDAFVATKLAEQHYQPPYFRLMERLNSEGAAAPRHPLSLPPLDAGEVERLGREAVLVDVRGTAAYLGAHPPRSLNLPESMVSAFAGWLLDPDQPLVLIARDAAQATTVARHLARIGYDRVVGYLDTTMPGWAALGGRLASVPAVGLGEVAQRVDERPQGWTLLDVRGADEVAQGVIEGAQTVYLGELPQHLDALDRGRHYTTMCASGARAAIAASVLRRHGFRAVDVFLGSMGAWQRAGCPVSAPAG
ncbi:MAG: MBL fold metallo-hydrolase [Bacteroidota bacterium]|nr:rhodanese-like domain-containing protein [Kiloniellaceae bacterium]